MYAIGIVTGKEGEGERLLVGSLQSLLVIAPGTLDDALHLQEGSCGVLCVLHLLLQLLGGLHIGLMLGEPPSTLYHAQKHVRFYVAWTFT